MALFKYTALFNDIKHTINNNVDIMCFRVKRNRNIVILVVYWILVQGMFIASLWKEIILLSIFLISLFIKYGLIIFYERCYLKYFKKQKRETSNNDTELIPLNNVDTHDWDILFCPDFNDKSIMRRIRPRSPDIDSFKYSVLISLHYYDISFHPERISKLKP